MANKSVKGPMAVNKSNTPGWMRVVIILIAISFVGSGIAVVVAGIAGGGSTQTTADGSAVATDTITLQQQARVDSAIAAAESNPNNPDIVIEVGHAYFEWAVALYESGQVQASIPIWKSAVSYYDRVLAMDPTDDVALGNKAFALYYAQDAELAPAALQAFIEGAADNASLSQQVENARGMLAELESAGTVAP